ncbi:MAG: DegV family EDD domain-containing protein [Coriobacteriales bacterium]|jgi:DegV family protein with EDD domain|nr:DegV family EDD domain-containing protein [Coriobacteriales bacterium]
MGSIVNNGKSGADGAAYGAESGQDDTGAEGVGADILASEALDIYTDDSCNLSQEWLTKHEVGLLPLSVMLDGAECPETLREAPGQFYTAIREGARPSTSSIVRGRVEEAFKNSAKRGRDILYIGLPAVLSSNFAQVGDIAKRIASECSQRICCMDARLATMGHGMLVEEAVRLRGEGRPLTTIHNMLEKLSDHIRILFILDDPQYLKVSGRGEEALKWAGRFISKLSVKLLLTINRQCSPKFHSAHRSRKGAIGHMMEYLHAKIDRARDQVIYVVHADIPRLAEMLVSAVRETLGANQRVEIAEVPPVLGAHVGPGTVALIFMSAEARS